MRKSFRKNFKNCIPLIILALFVLLLFKDLFSTRTLIPNLEPFPDSLYYIVPARNLAEGKGLLFSREGRSLSPNVPPLYSLAISPAYLFNQDPRFFYFVNILTALLSFYLLFKILNHLIKNTWIVDLVLFLYTTNYFIYWYPTIPMAENLILPIYLFGLLMLLQHITLTRIILMAFLPIAFIATKYANLPLMMFFLLAFVWKIIYFKTKNKVTNITTFILSLLISGLLFFGFEYIFKNHNILVAVFNLFNPSTLLKSSNNQNEVTANSWFSFQYISQNLPVYLNALIGKPMRFLWDFTPIVQNYIGIAALIGLIAGCRQKDKILISLSILISIFSTIFFLSTFYSNDARYIYFAIPGLLIGLAIFLDYLLKFRSYRRIGYFVLIGLFLFYSVTNLSRIKNQLALNFRHAETPWYYVSVLEVDKYFNSLPKQSNQKIAVISPMPPFLFDFYSSRKYTILPLSKDQEFRDFKDVIWGPNDYSDFNVLYKSYISRGYLVYVAEYGLGNEGYLHASFDQLKNDFNLVKVHEGCFNACNLYKLESK